MDTNCAATRHQQAMIHNLDCVDGGPVCQIRFKDGSASRFELVIGEQIPRAIGSDDSQARAFVDDLRVVESSREVMTFRFVDGSKFSMPLSFVSWTKFPPVFRDIPRAIAITDEMWSALSCFDPNAFPAQTRKLAQACAEKAGLMFVHIRAMAPALDSETGQLRLFLEGRHERPSPLAGFDGNAIQIEYEGLSVKVAVRGALTELKSFLDIYALLIFKLLDINKGTNFSRTKMGNREVCGMGFVKNLRKLASKRVELADVIERHINEWLHQAISLRDEAAHHASIATFRPIRAIVSRPNTTSVFRIELVPAALEDIELPAFFSGMLANFRRFVLQTQALLPIDHSALAEDQFGRF